MIEGGFVLFMLGLLLACSATVERAIIHRRWVRTEMVSPPLSTAFPLVPTSPTIDALVVDAGAALDADDLLRGVVAIGDTYHLAALERATRTGE